MHQEGHGRVSKQVYFHQQEPYKLRRDILRVQIIGFVLLFAWAFLPAIVEFARRQLHLLPW